MHPKRHQLPSPNNSISCFYTNATSLVNKWVDLIASISLEVSPPDIIFITETWFDEDSSISLPGYDLFRSNRQSQRGGGVAIYTKSSTSIVASEIDSSFFSTTPSSEQLWCKLSVGREGILLGCIYRPPSADTAENININSSLAKARQAVDHGKFDTLLIVGDFNYREIAWDSDGQRLRKAGCASPATRLFFDVVDANLLSQHVYESSFGNNTLDLVFTDDHERIYQARVGPPVRHSAANHQHNTITWKFSLQLSTNTKTQHLSVKLAYSKGDYPAISIKLRTASWSPCSHDLTGMYRNFLDIYNNVCRPHIPTKSGRACFGIEKAIRSSKEVKETLKAKHVMFAKARASNKHPHLKTEANRASRRVKVIFRLVRTELEASLARQSKANPRLLFAYINSQMSCRSGISSIIDHDGELASGKADIAQLLNDQFDSAFTKGSRIHPMPPFPSRTSVVCSVEEGRQDNSRQLSPNLTATGATHNHGAYCP